MIIRAFQIKNFRSIVDSGICYLSQDNITALIGQNESGKTSVLEALLSFYNGQITDDMLRSDLTFPEISCIFSLEKATLGELIDFSSLPVELHDALREKREIKLVRKWLSAHNSIFIISEPEVDQFYKSLKDKSDFADKKIRESLPLLEKQYEDGKVEQSRVKREIALVNEDVHRKCARLEDLNRQLKKNKKSELQVTIQQDIEMTARIIEEGKSRLRDLSTLRDQTLTAGNEIIQKLELCRKYVSVESSATILKREITSNESQIRNTEHQLELCTTDREFKNISRHLEQIRLIRKQYSEQMTDYLNEFQHLEKYTVRILEGKDIDSALKETTAELNQERRYCSAEEMGRQIYNYLPVFEFFEDFSSLLPNKIDLEDLLNENRYAEGYNAAQNFLRVAGLTSDFFREKNHRILKQMIENLNSEITINFQDYWCQHVGKEDKIRLNFELEHYDNTIPEKSGKPYLEFWIKDNQERLYPKQRSRGVRWFLSFYLELKATAKENHVNRVLLIDEPGLSLHARAQEDVLKVFEDLKGNMQIVYCTHSPHLIDLQRLHRIIAVQRANMADESSESLILDARSLSSASADTLTPIYSLMGTRLNDRQFIYPKNNIVVGDTSTLFYLEVMTRIFENDCLVHFIPSSGDDGILIMANLLFGWKIDFGILTFDNPVGKNIAESLRNGIFTNCDAVSGKKIREISGFEQIEDLFSTIDFKRYVLKQRIGITEQNSQFITANNLSRIILAADFCAHAEQEKLGMNDFDEESRANFESLFTTIRSMVE